jgi:hypothetical protein
MKLKPRPGGESFDPQRCAASSCRNPSDVIDATGRIAPIDIPLCERHWLKAGRALELANE